MITLDEAINRFEKLASDYEFNLNMHKNHVMNLSVNDIERMQGYLEENRQLAEWLRELKAYRDDCDYRTLKIKLENAEDVIRGLQEELRDAREELRREVNADDT